MPQGAVELLTWRSLLLAEEHIEIPFSKTPRQI
jgi:hypothetical protein